MLCNHVTNIRCFILCNFALKCQFDGIKLRSPSSFRIFVTMVTWVGLRQVLLAHINSPNPKTPLGTKIEDLSLIHVNL